MTSASTICTSRTISGPLHLRVALASLRHLRARNARLDPSRISLTIRHVQRGHKLPHTNSTEREEGAVYRDLVRARSLLLCVFLTHLGLLYGILRPRLFVVQPSAPTLHEDCALHLPLSCVLYGTSSLLGIHGFSDSNSMLRPSCFESDCKLSTLSLRKCTSESFPFNPDRIQDVFSLFPASFIVQRCFKYLLCT
ncbi:hypothetical protein C8F01DRAFT_1148036 [Mycena amicta]|nr:hypothetical protein C8F01DRAFT_1148036 [Mycena amicta]